ncbi:hypothetical protein DIC82_11500 [Clostridium beijerinckii]|nr:hypothetical protein DIC82_11500 [Clostridium beijerinckii]
MKLKDRETQMENIKLFVNRLIKTIILSSIIFNTVKINIVQYYLVILFIWFWLFWNYNMKKSKEIFDIAIITTLGNFVSYIYINKVLYSELINENFTWIGIAVISAFILIISSCSFFLNSYNYSKLNNNKLIFKREKDLERLLYYLDMFNIIGINAIWGGGKSFLVNELKEKIKDEYEIIEIDILSCNLDELQIILIKEIEKIMYKHGIISKYSNNLKKFFIDQNNIQQVWNLIFAENYSYSETIKGFKEELRRINKKIVIIYEDIDRISDEKVIKRIFGLSEKLTTNNIKIIYQYDEAKLKELKFASGYLEKYIPYKMNLTEMNFFEIVKFVLKENGIDKDILEMKDFDFMRNHAQMYRYNILKDEFGMDKELYMNILNFSVRSVEHYIFELNIILKDEEYKKEKETVISFFFIKHFLPDIYEKLNIENGLLETLKFNFESNSYTITELISMYKLKELNNEKINEIFNDDQNKINYCISRLFNYNNDQIIEESDYKNKLNSRMEEPIKGLKNRINNEKKDRLIWNLLENGKSKDTNYEYVGKRFINEVLIKPKDEQISAYGEFWDSIFYLDSKEVDNGTIFLMGVPSFVELFKAFRILDATDEQEIALIDCYFQIENITDINTEFIQTINYCALKTNREYVYILNKINQLNIIGNLNFEKSFSDFIKKYIGALSKHGYINTNEYYYINGSNHIKEESKEHIIKELQKISNKINDLKNTISNHIQINELECDLETIIEFINKIIEIVSCNTPFENKEKNSIRSSWSSKFRNQNEYERLKGILSENSDFNNEIKESYLSGKITVYEIDKLLG